MFTYLLYFGYYQASDNGRKLLLETLDPMHKPQW